MIEAGWLLPVSLFAFLLGVLAGFVEAAKRYEAREPRPRAGKCRYCGETSDLRWFRGHGFVCSECAFALYLV